MPSNPVVVSLDLGVGHRWINTYENSRKEKEE